MVFLLNCVDTSSPAPHNGGDSGKDREESLDADVLKNCRYHDSSPGSELLLPKKRYAAKTPATISGITIAAIIA